MEANEAPEKIYVHVKNDKVTNTWNSTWKGVRDVEYTRTDTFVEKACAWMDEHCKLLTSKDYEDFKNYLKGE